MGSLGTGSQETTALRALDAAANRAREGLRTIEDYVRFVLDDQHLTALCKHLRHDMAQALAGIPLKSLLASRKTQADVGTTLEGSAEHRRRAPRGCCGPILPACRNAAQPGRV